MLNNFYKKFVFLLVLCQMLWPTCFYGLNKFDPWPVITSLHVQPFHVSDHVECLDEYEKMHNDQRVSLPASSVLVATSLALSEQENKFIAQRLKKIMPILQQTFNISHPLCIGFACSGGGVRAMIGSMGIFQAAARAKILQVSMYMAGLSGSTWLIAPWSYLYLQNKLHQNVQVSLQQMVQNWIKVLDQSSMRPDVFDCYLPALLNDDQSFVFSSQVAQRWSYDQQITLVDLYGALIGNFVLDLVGKDKLKVVWSAVSDRLQNGEIPLPLCATIFDTVATQNNMKANVKYGWCEITPFQAGGAEIGYIPLPYLGSTFKQGRLDRVKPEYPLSFFMGVCGSAFAFSLDDLLKTSLPNSTCMIDTEEISIPVDAVMHNSVVHDTHTRSYKRLKFMFGRFFNFSVDLPTSILQKKEELGLFDAGIDFNFPLPVLLDRPDRKLDLIFLYDSNPGDEVSLKDIATYYKIKKHIAVPDMSQVTQKDLLAHTMTVFNDPRLHGYDAQVPTILYFPTRGLDVTKPPYMTLNFRYTQDQMKQLIKVTDNAFTSQISEIKKIMKLVAKARHPK